MKPGLLDKQVCNKKLGITQLRDLGGPNAINRNPDYVKAVEESPNVFKKQNGIFTHLYNAAHRFGETEVFKCWAVVKNKKVLIKKLKNWIDEILIKTLTFKKLILSLIFHSFVFYDILENRVCPLWPFFIWGSLAVVDDFSFAGQRPIRCLNRHIGDLFALMWGTNHSVAHTRFLWPIYRNKHQNGVVFQRVPRSESFPNLLSHYNSIITFNLRLHDIFLGIFKGANLLNDLLRYLYEGSCFVWIDDIRSWRAIFWRMLASVHDSHCPFLII